MWALFKVHGVLEGERMLEVGFEVWLGYAMVEAALSLYMSLATRSLHT